MEVATRRGRARKHAPSRPRRRSSAPFGTVGMRWSLSLAGCVLVIALPFFGCDGSDASTGPGDAGAVQDSRALDSSIGDGDAGEMVDASTPGGAGVEDCVKACEIFLMTNCSTPAADFCESAQQNCLTRYDAHPKCRAQLDAMDACAAAQPVANFTCPLGTMPNVVRPYNVTEDVCVGVATALIDCLAANP